MAASFREYSSRLLTRFMHVAIAAAATVCVLFFPLSVSMNNDQASQTALAEARSLVRELQAAGAYADAAAGRPASSGAALSQAAVGFMQGVAASFTGQDGGYAASVVLAGQGGGDGADGFEARALDALEREGRAEYHEVLPADGSTSLFYALRVEAETGLAAVLVTVPMGSYVTASMRQAVFASGFFVAAMAGIGAMLNRLLRKRLVGPIEDEGARLEEDAAAKSDFLTLMGHELRTPLSSIIAYTDIWEDMAGGRGEQEASVVRAVRGNSEVLLDMVNNVIDTAKLDAGKYELRLEDVDLRDVMGTVQDMAGSMAAERGVELSLELDPETPVVRADWEAVRKILTNLVGNALKFTARGGHVAMSSTFDARGGTVTVSVSDDGCGIAEEDLERIFGRFEQGASAPGAQRAARSSGSGLGLSLSRDLARMLGGDLSVASELGRGSTFSLTIPVGGADGGQGERGGRS